MEFEGRIQRVLPVRSGMSQRGEWKALPFVFEYFESGEQRWSDKVLLETFDTNIMAQIGAYLKKGQDGKAVVENGECVLLGELKCKCGFSHNVRTFERQVGTMATVNDLRLYKFEVITQVAAVQPQMQQPAYQPHAQMPFGAPQPQGGGGETDDLPF
jgi:hypothetical protein